MNALRVVLHRMHGVVATKLFPHEGLHLLLERGTFADAEDVDIKIADDSGDAFCHAFPTVLD